MMRVRGAALSLVVGLESGDLARWGRARALPAGAARWHAHAVQRWEQGRVDEAAAALLEARALAPGDAALLATQRSLQDYRAAWARSCFALDDPDAPFRLLPAHPRLAAGLHRVGRDGEVAFQAGLPAWSTVEATARWVAGFCRPPARLLGVAAHPEHGPVGAVSLRRTGTAALVAYFLGPRFHGRGWGSALVRAGRAAAGRAGIDTLWAFVRPANEPSLRALAADGFVPAPFRASTSEGPLAVRLAGALVGQDTRTLVAACDALSRALHLSWRLEHPVE